MWIKVCGLNNPENLESILQLPVDMVGFIFFEKSPRKVNPKKLLPWLEDNQSAFKHVKKVGVFVNQPLEDILNLSSDYHFDFVQLHGQESPEYCNELNIYKSVLSTGQFKVMKALPGNLENLEEAVHAYAPFSDMFLFDHKNTHGDFGGTGAQFDWTVLDGLNIPKPFLLSGGISTNDLESILKFNHPQFRGIDINSKFEISPGEKNIPLVEEFSKKLKSNLDDYH
jgi:phosphoribosylanthranilate isomerase